MEIIKKDDEFGNASYIIEIATEGLFKEVRRRMNVFVGENKISPELIYMDAVTYKRMQIYNETELKNNYFSPSFYSVFDQAKSKPQLYGLDIITIPTTEFFIMFGFKDNDENFNLALENYKGDKNGL